MIVNLTHNKNGSVRLRRSITTKVAIGLPPGAGANFPKKLDHFVFQKKGAAQVEVEGKKRTEVVWQIDEELQKHYGDNCKSIWIVLLDDDADVALRTELAWWSKTQRNCYGDGEVGHLKVSGPRGASEQERPCANNGCADWAAGICKPSGDLYFLLADFPSLGTICKLHTTSFQSITEIRTALEDLRSVTGGRLMGLRVKLTVRIEKNVFRDKKKNGALTTSTKHVLGLELAAADVKALTASLTENMKLFSDVRLKLGARSVDIVEDPDEAVAPAMAAEFYPAEAINPAEKIPPASVTIIEGNQRGGKTESVRQEVDQRVAMAAADGDVLPAEMYTPIDPTPWSKADATEFFKAWSKSGHKEQAVRDFMRDHCNGVTSSFKIPLACKGAAMRWAGTRAAPPPLPPQSDLELECRQVMGLLGLNLTEQMEIIDQCRGDWEEIKAELRFRGDRMAQEAK